jgi:glycosyltransferase involved in cell wall biosynthesis
MTRSSSDSPAPVPLSIVTPARGAEHDLRLALAALRASTPPPAEIVLVDDASPRSLEPVAREFGCRYLRREVRGGPGAARNDGVAVATAPYVLFVDSDVVVPPDLIGRIAERMAAPDGPSALFGGYDDAPGSPRFLAQYKNLVHHFIHQGARREAATFWAGCGAVRKADYLAVGGFDIELFDVPSVEDIDLGYRLTDRGFRVELDPSLQCRHLKDWRWLDLLRTDVLKRAVPWTRLMLARGSVPPDLNLRPHHRISAALVGLLVLAPGAAFFSPRIAAGAAAALVVALLVLNRDLYGFFLRKRGAWFLARSIPAHWLYYLYSAAAFAVTRVLWSCGIRGRFGARRTR